MSRPKINDTRINMVIPSKLLDVVKRFAEIRRVSVAQIFRESVRDYVRQEAEKARSERERLAKRAAAAQPEHSVQ